MSVQQDSFNSKVGEESKVEKGFDARAQGSQ